MEDIYTDKIYPEIEIKKNGLITSLVRKQHKDSGKWYLIKFAKQFRGDEWTEENKLKQFHSMVKWFMETGEIDTKGDVKDRNGIPVMTLDDNQNE